MQGQFHKQNAEQKIITKQIMLVTSQTFIQIVYTLAGCLFNFA